MITVAILINGQPIYTRTAVNTGAQNMDGQTIYDLDDGTTLRHFRKDGAVVLAEKMLKTIKDTGNVVPK